MEENIGANDCKDLQIEALESGCITQEEYETLVLINHVPSCIKGTRLMSWCPCGCFDPQTLIWVNDKESDTEDFVPIWHIVKNTSRYGIWSFEKESKLSKPHFVLKNILISTHGPESKPLIDIGTKGGYEISLTTGHGVLLYNGKMVEAKTLVVGDVLVNDEGQPEEIIEIKHKVITEEVLNLLVEDENRAPHHLIIAKSPNSKGKGGLIVGDLAWQNSLSKQLGSVCVSRE